MEILHPPIRIQGLTINIYPDSFSISEDNKEVVRFNIQAKNFAIDSSQSKLAISSNGNLTVIDLLKKETHWQRNFPGLYQAPQTTAPVFFENNLYVGVGKPSAKLYCFNTENGSEQWAQVLATGVPSDPILFSDRIAVIGSRKIAYVYDIKSGTQIYAHQVTGKTENLAGISHQGSLFLTDSDGNLTKLNRDGKLLWQWRFFEHHPELALLRKKGMSGQQGKGFDEKCTFEEIRFEERISVIIRFNKECFENKIPHN